MKSFRFDPKNLTAGSALRRAMPYLVGQRHISYDPRRSARMNDLVFAEVIKTPMRARGNAIKNWLERVYPDGAEIKLRNEWIGLGDCIGVVGNRYAPPYLLGGFTHPITGTPNGEIRGGSVVDALFGMNAVGYLNHTAFPDERAFIKVHGVVVDKDGQPLNLSRFRESFAETPPRQPSSTSVIVVTGYSTDAGKTTCAWALAGELRNRGFRVTLEKKSGTACCRDWLRCCTAPGAGALDKEGDEFSFNPASFPARDFVDALGVVSDMSIETNIFVAESVRYTEAFLSRARPDFHIIELADSISHVSNAALLRTDYFRRRIDALVYACIPSAEAAAHCLAYVRSLGYLRTPLLFSGPLANEDRHAMAREEVRARLKARVCRSAVHQDSRWIAEGSELLRELLEQKNERAGRRQIGC